MRYFILTSLLLGAMMLGLAPATVSAAPIGLSVPALSGEAQANQSLAEPVAYRCHWHKRCGWKRVCRWRYGHYSCRLRWRCWRWCHKHYSKRRRLYFSY
jgi:hypothetical protein